jgi:hypothetical protein
MAQNKKRFKRPIGKAKKTGVTEAWPWERKSGFCQSDSHPWHVCLAFAEQKEGAIHTMFTYSDRQSAYNKSKALNKIYKNSNRFITYVRNWKTGEEIET